jgi:concanavalin A-like lectin/glucanase superfamily protein/Ig-like domain-containing protein
MRKLAFLVLVTCLALAGSAVGQEYTDVTVGSADPGGTVVTEGVYEVTGNGNDIWGTADAFQYHYTELIGDGSMVARVTSIGEGSNAWAKGGVMIRQSLDAGSMHAITALTGSEGGGAAFQRRIDTDGASTSNHGLADGPYAAPYWVKTERVGNDFTGYISADGETWVQAGDTMTIEMADPVLIGLAVTSHAAGELRTFTFDNVAVEVVPGPPIITAVQDDVVMPGEDAQLAVEAIQNGESDLTYQWYRATVEMMGIVLTDVPLPEGVNAVLDVPAADVGDEGDYYCVVSNDVGSVTSDFVILDVQVGLVHRWSFTEDGADSVGGADAVVVNNTGNAAIVDGAAVMGNVGTESSNDNNGDYVDLPNGLISKLSQMTVQCWATYDDDDLQIWSRILSFGESNNGEDTSASGDASTYVTIQPNRSGNLAGAEYRNKGAALDIVLNGRVPLHEEVQYTLVHDDLAGTTKLYLDGVVQAGTHTNVTLKEFNDINMWLGRSQWNDRLFIGSFNECRIYDTALTAEEIGLSYLAGPDELPVPLEPCDVALAGDWNGDCVVDALDTSILADQWLTQSLED